MIGEVKTKASIVGTLEAKASVVGEVSTKTIIGEVELGRVTIRHSDYPDYDGDYDITPAASEQTLETTNKTLREDLTIKPIPYYDVSNEYGRTIYIGGDLNG